jgi:FkbM family methyltransferase
MGIVESTLDKIKRILRYDVFPVLGFRVEKGGYPGYMARRKSVLEEVDTVIDVGALEGQYANEIREIGFNGNILSFEPIKEVYQELERNSSNDEKWKVFNMALGRYSGKETINVSENMHSSSILDMMKKHKKNAPKSDYVRREKVDVERLDSLFYDICNAKNSILLKIDTQGYEDRILKGCEKCIRNISFIQMEMSLQKLYKESWSLDDAVKKMYNMGFVLISVEEGFVSTNGKLLQVDGIFEYMG